MTIDMKKLREDPGSGANVETVIALLDEIERLRNALALEHRTGSAIEDILQRKDAQLAAMTKARDEACDLASKLGWGQPVETGWSTRIAELRKVGQ